MLNTHEVEKILKVCRGTVNNMMKDGRIPYVRIGRAVRFKEEDIEKIREEGTDEPSQVDKDCGGHI